MNDVKGEPHEATNTPGPPVIDLHFLFYPKGDEWYAECLDLDLLTARSDLAPAFRELLVQVEMYLRTAAESGRWPDYVPRNAPARDWIAYYRATVRQELHRWFAGGRSLPTPRTGHFLFDAFGHPVGA